MHQEGLIIWPRRFNSRYAKLVLSQPTKVIHCINRFKKRECIWQNLILIHWKKKVWNRGKETLQSPLDLKVIKPVHPKGNQCWIFIERTDAEAETPILWPPDTTNWLWKRLWCWGRLKAGGEGDDRGWDGWIAITDSMDMRLSKLQELVMNRIARHIEVHGVTKNQTQLSNWTELKSLSSRSQVFNP